MNRYDKDDIITMSDTAFDGKAGIAEIMRIFQSAVTQHTHLLGVDAPAVYKKLGAKWVITRIRFEIDKRLRVGDEYTVSTWPLEAKPLRFGRSFVISTKDGTAVRAYSDWCLLDTKTDAVIRSSRLSMPIDEYLTDTVTESKFSMAKGEFTADDALFSRTMRVSDLDLNRHVNNISYIKLALDCFSANELDALDIKSFEMYYVSQCYEGDTLTLYRNGNCIEARCGADTVFRCTVNL